MAGGAEESLDHHREQEKGKRQRKLFYFFWDIGKVKKHPVVICPRGCTKDRAEEVISGGICALVRGWALHRHVGHLCRSLYSLLINVGSPRNRKPNGSALRVRCK